jgi:hypothetical protein
MIRLLTEQRIETSMSHYQTALPVGASWNLKRAKNIDAFLDRLKVVLRCGALRVEQEAIISRHSHFIRGPFRLFVLFSNESSTQADANFRKRI